MCIKHATILKKYFDSLKTLDGCFDKHQERNNFFISLLHLHRKITNIRIDCIRRLVPSMLLSALRMWWPEIEEVWKDILCFDLSFLWCWMLINALMHLLPYLPSYAFNPPPWNKNQRLWTTDMPIYILRGTCNVW